MQARGLPTFVIGLLSLALVGATTPALAGSSHGVIATISVGDRPEGIAIDNGSLYVANNSAGTVSVVDEATRTVTNTITVGTSPYGVVADGASVYVTNAGSNSVSVIDVATETVTHTVSVGQYPKGIAVRAGSLYVTNNNGSSLSVINEASAAVTDTVTVGASPAAIAASSDGIYFTTSTNSGSVSRLDPATDKVTWTTATGAFANAMVVLDGSVYIPSVLSGIAVVDATSGTKTGTISAAGSLSGIAVNGNLLDVTVSNSLAVDVVDPSTAMVTDNFRVGGGPEFVAADGGLAYVTNSNDDTVSVVADVPDAPTGLTASPQPGKVTLSWSAPTSDGGSPVTGYRVYETDPAGDVYSGTPVVCEVAETSCTVTSLTPLTTYHFVVEAVSAAGSSAPSGSVAATIPAPKPTLALSGGHLVVAEGSTHSLHGRGVAGASIALYDGSHEVATTSIAGDGTYSFVRKLTKSTTYRVVSDGQVSAPVAMKVVGLTLRVIGKRPLHPGRHRFAGHAPRTLQVRLYKDGKRVATSTAGGKDTFSFARTLTGTHHYRIRCDGVTSPSIRVSVHHT